MCIRVFVYGCVIYMLTYVCVYIKFSFYIKVPLFIITSIVIGKPCLNFPELRLNDTFQYGLNNVVVFHFVLFVEVKVDYID